MCDKIFRYYLKKTDLIKLNSFCVYIFLKNRLTCEFKSKRGRCAGGRHGNRIKERDVVKSLMGPAGGDCFFLAADTRTGQLSPLPLPLNPEFIGPDNHIDSPETLLLLTSGHFVARRINSAANLYGAACK